MNQDRRRALILAAILIVFLVQAAARLYTRVPWCDEGFFGDPATTLLERHDLGSRAADPNRLWLTGDDYQEIDRYFYYLPPLYPVSLAGWWAIAGYGLQSMRWLSVAFGALLLVSTYSLARCLAGNDNIALLATALLSIDYHFITAGADGRMDCMDTALGFAGLAFFLRMQEQGRTYVGVAGGHVLIGLGCLTHPNAIFYVPLLLVLMFFKGVLNLSTLTLSVVPYVVELSVWGVYIAQDPRAFAAQFNTNLAQRLGGYHQPLESIVQELARYDVSAGNRNASEWMKALTTIPLLIGALALCVRPALRRLHAPLLSVLTLLVILMTFLMGRKWDGYLVDILPLYVIALAACLLSMRRAGAVLLAGIYFLASGAFTIHAIYLDRYHEEFVPVTEFLRSQAKAPAAIMGAAYLGFGVGFDRLHDDFTMGLRQGPLPDVIVYDEWYDSLTQSERRNNPPLYQHIQNTLASARPLYSVGQYHVYACLDTCHAVIQAFRHAHRDRADL